jgi:hypothetical protein
VTAATTTVTAAATTVTTAIAVAATIITTVMSIAIMMPTAVMAFASIMSGAMPQVIYGVAAAGPPHVTGSHPAMLHHVLIHVAQLHPPIEAVFKIVEKAIDMFGALTGHNHELEVPHLPGVVTPAQCLARNMQCSRGIRTLLMKPRSNLSG